MHAHPCQRGSRRETDGSKRALASCCRPSGRKPARGASPSAQCLMGNSMAKHFHDLKKKSPLPRQLCSYKKKKGEKECEVPARLSLNLVENDHHRRAEMYRNWSIVTCRRRAKQCREFIPWIQTSNAFIVTQLWLQMSCSDTGQADKRLHTNLCSVCLKKKKRHYLLSSLFSPSPLAG